MMMEVTMMGKLLNIECDVVLTFSCGPMREIPSGRDRCILPSWIANQNAGFASSCPLADSAISQGQNSEFTKQDGRN